MISSPYVEVHKSPNGVGDARPTALQVVKDMGQVDNLKGMTVLLTGGNQGLGYETVRALYTTGAKIYITARDMDKGSKAAKELSTDASRPVEVIQMELDSFESVRKGAQEFLERSKSLNILVCNAGIMAPPFDRTKDGFELQFGTNHLGHFLLFQLLQPTLLASSTSQFASRVISVSSSGHRAGGIHVGDYNFESKDNPYQNWMAYGQAKTANIYFANEIERRFGDKGVHALSLHPGFIGTNLARHVMDDPLAKEVHADPAGVPIYKSVEQGAATATWAAVSKELEGAGGLYLDDVQEAGPWSDKTSPMFGPGYAPHAFDKEAAQKLWEDSLRFTGVQA